MKCLHFRGLFRVYSHHGRPDYLIARGGLCHEASTCGLLRQAARNESLNANDCGVKMALFAAKTEIVP
jgi:hypothetical protein